MLVKEESLARQERSPLAEAKSPLAEAGWLASLGVVVVWFVVLVCPVGAVVVAMVVSPVVAVVFAV